MRRGVDAVLAMALVSAVAACTGADVATTSEASPTSGTTLAQSSWSESAVAASSPPASPADAALAAYERYTAASVEALAAGDAPAVELSDVAADQALNHVRRRLRANSRDGVVVKGSLEPSATPEDVRYDGATATVTDCALNALEQVDADDPDRVVTEATGWRQPVTATVEQRDSGWIVTRVRVPLRDASGRVPPPPDDPPYLRGPAQGPAPPSCVPPDLARAAVAGYEAFVDAYDRAIGFGGVEADPSLPALAETAVDPQLSAAREFAESLAADGVAFRGERNIHDPWTVSAADGDRQVFIYDCVTVGSYGQASAAKTEPDDVTAAAGTQRLDVSIVVRDSERWKVAERSTVEEGMQECTSAGA